jgi:hypothetical protein
MSARTIRLAARVVSVATVLGGTALLGHLGMPRHLLAVACVGLSCIALGTVRGLDWALGRRRPPGGKNSRGSRSREIRQAELSQPASAPRPVT